MMSNNYSLDNYYSKQYSLLYQVISHHLEFLLLGCGSQGSNYISIVGERQGTLWGIILKYLKILKTDNKAWQVFHLFSALLETNLGC